MPDEHSMCYEWYTPVSHNHPNMTRTDFRIAQSHRRRVKRRYLLAYSIAELLKAQRLLPNEIEAWNNSLDNGEPLDVAFVERLRLAIAEGVLKADLETVDDDAFIGTCGQLLFRWVRSQYYGREIIYSSPKLQTDSSTKQGIDCFEILGDPNDADSLYFIVWEVKATDHSVNSRTDEIYQMHRYRTPRLLRGLQLQLSLEYPEDTGLGRFARQLFEHWQLNTGCKRIGGAVIFDTSNDPGEVFTTFHTQFPELDSALCRQVILVEVPKFRKVRSKLWRYLQAQMS